MSKYFIHPPKQLSSKKGWGPKSSLVEECISTKLLITTETWGQIEEVWNIGPTIIAKPGYKWIIRWETGQNYVITKFVDETGQIAGIYCDLCSPVKKNDDGYEAIDWYLDVWQPAGEQPRLLDEDELELAMSVGYLTSAQAELARSTAEQLIGILENGLLDF